MSSLAIQRISIRNLRNLREVEVYPAALTNVFCGANGQGKTSVLEAIYLVATSRSFRTNRMREIVCHDAEVCSVRAEVGWEGQVREQLIAVSEASKVIKVDGQRPRSVASFAVATPVVVFHPGELALTMGSAGGRRTLLDRVGLFLDVRSHHERLVYEKALRARQQVLLRGNWGEAVLESYEQLMAEHGATLTQYRAKAAVALATLGLEYFEKLTEGRVDLRVRYEPGGVEDAVELKKRLVQSRSKDAHRATAGVGPHKDDLVLELGGRTARVVASQGQHRLLTLSLKMAEMGCIRKATGSEPILLLDDVSSELDANRTDALISLLGNGRNQVFVTTTRPELLKGMSEFREGFESFEVVSGHVRVGSSN